MHPSSSRTFQRYQEHDLRHLGSVDLIATKQNKLPSFTDGLVWPVLLAQVWTHYERKSCLNWMVSLQVWPLPQLIFPSKTWFFGIYLNSQWHKLLKKQYLSHFESKFHQINSINSCSSRSFQQHQRHIPISLKNFSYGLIQFSVNNSFDIQELLI
jgi:hypothetical protein